MKEQKLIIEVVVGYMLKVLKNGKTIDLYDQQFKHIRHGNYYDFIKMFKEVPAATPALIYMAGEISVRTEVQKDDFDFLALNWAGPALRFFGRDCILHYGIIQDPDVSDRTFEQAAMFEIGLRMHAAKNGVSHRGMKLENVIDNLCEHKQLDELVKTKLHTGRQFLNVIKHTEKLNNKFPSWPAGVKAFNEAFAELEHQGFTVM